MTNNPNEPTIENSAVVLIDHQPAAGLAVNSMDKTQPAPLKAGRR